MTDFIPNYRKLGLDGYSDYLNSRHWVQLKRTYLESGQSRECRICEGSKQLVLHHRTYETLGHEDIYKDVVLLCQPCHTKIHFFRDQKTPLRYKELWAREQYLYKEFRTVRARLLRFRLGSFINNLFTPTG